MQDTTPRFVIGERVRPIDPKDRWRDSNVVLKVTEYYPCEVADRKGLYTIKLQICNRGDCFVAAQPAEAYERY